MSSNANSEGRSSTTVTQTPAPPDPATLAFDVPNSVLTAENPRAACLKWWIDNAREAGHPIAEFLRRGDEFNATHCGTARIGSEGFDIYMRAPEAEDDTPQVYAIRASGPRTRQLLGLMTGTSTTVTGTITDRAMTSTGTNHRAWVVDGKDQYDPGAWRVSWFDSEPFDRNQAITAMHLAEYVNAGVVGPADPKWPFVQGWAAELRIEPGLAVSLIQQGGLTTVVFFSRYGDGDWVEFFRDGHVEDYRPTLDDLQTTGDEGLRAWFRGLMGHDPRDGEEIKVEVFNRAGKLLAGSRVTIQPRQPNDEDVQIVRDYVLVGQRYYQGEDHMTLAGVLRGAGYNPLDHLDKPGLVAQIVSGLNQDILKGFERLLVTVYDPDGRQVGSREFDEHGVIEYGTAAKRPGREGA
jgi:hypothetical protein